MLDRFLALDMPSRLAAISATALLLLAIFALGRCDGSRREAARQEVLRAEAVASALAINAAALDAAAEQRAADRDAVAAHQKGMKDAIDAVPDARPDAVRIALGCERLRAQGRAGADLPAACRPGGGAQAGGAR